MSMLEVLTKTSSRTVLVIAASRKDVYYAKMAYNAPTSGGGGGLAVLP